MLMGALLLCMAKHTSCKNSCQITIKIMMICVYFQPKNKNKNPSVSIQSLYLPFRYLHLLHLLNPYIYS